MKTYRLVLASFGTVFVEADSVTESDGRITFHRDGNPYAEYTAASVKSYEVAEVSPLRFPMAAEREDSQCP